MRRLVVVFTGAVGFVGGLLASAASAQATYPITVGGNQVTRVGGIQVSRGSLAFTGSSSHTLTYVLIALGLVAVGLVLVVATRRRLDLLHRA